jgi:7-carboxy-7-deazaguanine synthase
MSESTYRVKEIFGPTLQGEGSNAGTVVLFLRFAGCNRWTGLDKDRPLSICKFCDTDFRGGEPMTAYQISARLEQTSQIVKHVVVTGGEPTLQIDEELLRVLRGNGFVLHLETNGSRALGELRKYIHHVTMSPKQSLELTKLESTDDLKLLYPPISADITLENFNAFRSRNKFLQPIDDKDRDANLRATVCRLLGNPDWRLSLQTHKIVGVQ